MPEPMLVRVAPEILDLLDHGQAEPVVLLGAQRCDDGTYDLILRQRPAADVTRAYRCPDHGLIESPSWHDDEVEEDSGFYCPINLTGQPQAPHEGITDMVCGKDVTGPFEVIETEPPQPESPEERHHRQLHDGELNQMPPEHE